MRELTPKKISTHKVTASPISHHIHWSHSKLKLVTWAGVRYCEVELRFIHSEVGECNPSTGDIVDLHSVPDIRVHSSDVQGEGRGPGKSNNISLRKSH